MKSNDTVVVRTFAVRHTSPHTIAPHAHDWHQLIYASEGAMWVRTAQGEWVVPPNRAVWVPAGVEHGIEMTGTVFVQTLYLAVGVSSSLPGRCCAVNVSPLLRELILHTIRLGMLDQDVPSRRRLIDFLLDQLSELPTAPLQLPLPTDARAKRAVEWMRTHPEENCSIKTMAKRVSASARTLERLFQKQTGMTFGQWRQQLRLLHALRLLAGGNSVTNIAFAVGYESVSAFIAAFKSYFGATPARYFD